MSAEHAVSAEVRQYETLFSEEFPEAVEDFRSALNPDSIKRLESCPVEPSLAEAQPGDRFQFERIGYFCADADSKDGAPVFNRTVTLRDSWARAQKKGGG